MIIIGIVLVIALSLLYFQISLSLFNQLLSAIEEAAKDLETILLQRFDAAKRLAETVKKNISIDNNTLIQHTDDLIAALKAGSGNITELFIVNSAMTKHIRVMLEVAATHPDMKTDLEILELFHHIEDLDIELEKSQRYYNSLVENQNQKIQSLPLVIVARSRDYRAMMKFGDDEMAKE